MAQKQKTGPNKIRNAIGGFLRTAREAKKWSQEDVTAKLQLYGWDLDRTAWTKIELGQRAVTDCELIAIADVLEIEIGTLASKADRKLVSQILGRLKR